MSFWKWADRPAKFGTFEEKPLKDGALKDAVIGMLEGETPAKAIVKAITKDVPPTGENTMDDTKPAVASKINGIGAVVTALGGVLLPIMGDPGVQQAVSQVETILPASWIPWITMFLGVSTVVARTFFTKKKISGVVTTQQ